MMNSAAMLFLLLSSVLSFLLLFAALLLLLRRAASRARAAGRPAPARPPSSLPRDCYNSESNPRLPAKRPDWRFLVRGRRLSRSAALRRATPESPTTPEPPPKPILTSDGKPRSDWAYFNADLGDLQDPSESLSLPRRA